MMYIESIYIGNFAGLHRFGLELSGGLNIIEGKNESGKSTIGAFLRFLFYGFTGKEDRERHMSFLSGSAEGSAIVNCDGKRYRIERRAAGTRETLAIIDLDDGSRCFEGKVPGEVFFRLPERLFVSTVFVGQTTGRKINGRETAEAVENLLFSADETVSVKKTLQLLDKARTALLHKNKKGGRIRELEDRIASLSEARREASDMSGERISLGGSVEALRNRIRSEEKQLEELQENLRIFEILEIRKRNHRLQELEKQYRRSVEEADRFRLQYTRGGFFPDRQYLQRLRDCGEELSAADGAIRDIRGELEQFEREAEIRRADRRNRSERLDAELARLSYRRSLAVAAAFLCCLLFIVAASAGVLMLLGGSQALGVGLLSASALLFAGMVTGFVFSSRHAAERKRLEAGRQSDEDNGHARLEQIRLRLEKANEERARYKTMLDDLCGQWRITPSTRALTELTDVLEKSEKLAQKTEFCRVAYVNLKTEAEERSAYEAEDDGQPCSLPDKFDPKEAGRRKSFLTARIKIDTETLHRDELRLTQLSAVSVSPAELTEEITALEQERDRLTEKHDACLLAYEALEEASRKMRGGVSPRLSETAGRLMAAVTDGKYEELGVDGSFSLTFRPDNGNGTRMTREEEYMSAGTADAAYVSLRLALASFLCGSDRLPPMIFDESFSRLDDGRLTNMLRILEGSRAQVLLLTSLDREARLAGGCGGLRFRTVSLD